eukprot:2040061-Lingulodinium_polyedra.AAC.1
MPPAKELRAPRGRPRSRDGEIDELLGAALVDRRLEVAMPPLGALEHGQRAGVAPGGRAGHPGVEETLAAAPL